MASNGIFAHIQVGSANAFFLLNNLVIFHCNDENKIHMESNLMLFNVV